VQMQEDVNRDLGLEKPAELKPGKVVNPCPQCGEELAFEGGCNVCKSCGWTKCE